MRSERLTVETGPAKRPPPRWRRVVIAAIALVACGFLLRHFQSRGPQVDPPGVTLVGLEPIGVYDEAGTECWLITVNLHNLNSGKESVLFIKDAGRMIDAQAGGRWKEVSGTSLMLGRMKHVELWPGVRPFETEFLAPIGTTTCRFWIQYAPGVKRGAFKAGVGRLAMRLPLAIRNQLSYRFWRWVGFAPYWIPASRWKEAGLEVVLEARR